MELDLLKICFCISAAVVRVNCALPLGSLQGQLFMCLSVRMCLCEITGSERCPVLWSMDNFIRMPEVVIPLKVS